MLRCEASNSAVACDTSSGCTYLAGTGAQRPLGLLANVQSRCSSIPRQQGQHCMWHPCGSATHLLFGTKLGTMRMSMIAYGAGRCLYASEIRGVLRACNKRSPCCWCLVRDYTTMWQPAWGAQPSAACASAGQKLDSSRVFASPCSVRLCAAQRGWRQQWRAPGPPRQALQPGRAPAPPAATCPPKIAPATRLARSSADTGIQRLPQQTCQLQHRVPMQMMSTLLALIAVK